MAKKIVRTVTVTGADDSVRPDDLVSIAKEFPFVEFGILLQNNPQGSLRFPSRDWLDKLYVSWFPRGRDLALSGHLCGRWVKDLCLGKPSFFENFGYTWNMFDRLQLNFHAQPHKMNDKEFGGVLREYLSQKMVIFQMDGVKTNENMLHSMVGRWHISAYPLFDTSGGRGVLPKEWPEYFGYCGYAGGLSPENVGEELGRISKIARSQIWIDTETLVRSEDDEIFDLEKVRRFLKASKPWVIGT